MSGGRRRGATLIEVLAAVAVVGLLAGLGAPGLRMAREAARAAACAANLRSLQLANDGHAAEHDGRYAPGAARPIENLERWHGSREHQAEAFDPARGPLTLYLAGPSSSGVVRRCPSFLTALEAGARDADADVGFEAGCGGYGYNNAFVGTQRRRLSDDVWAIAPDGDALGSRRWDFAHPGATIGFTDAALAGGSGGNPLIEYSFAEPRFWPESPPSAGFRPDPSIHFRHGAYSVDQKTANVAWLDGHVSGMRRTFWWASGLYEADPGRAGIGWFGEQDSNDLFAYE